MCVEISQFQVWCQDWWHQALCWSFDQCSERILSPGISLCHHSWLARCWKPSSGRFGTVFTTFRVLMWESRIPQYAVHAGAGQVHPCCTYGASVWLELWLWAAMVEELWWLPHRSPDWCNLSHPCHEHAHWFWRLSWGMLDLYLCDNAELHQMSAAAAEKFMSMSLSYVSCITPRSCAALFTSFAPYSTM